MSLIVAPVIATYDPPNDHWYHQLHPRPDFKKYRQTNVQPSFGKAWQFKNGRKFMSGFNLPVFIQNDRVTFFPALDFYFQATHDERPSAHGFGIMIGMDPALYYMWGQRLGDGYREAGFDFAFGVGFIRSVFTEFRITKDYGEFQAGFFGKYNRYLQTLDICWENCGYKDYLKSYWMFGIIIMQGD